MFIRKMNCGHCGNLLHLHDLKSNNWVDDIQKFVFECGKCKEETHIAVNLFDEKGHINKIFIAVIKEYKDYLYNGQLKQIIQHLENCEYCKKKIEDEQLSDIEDKIRFNETSFSHFEANGVSVDEVPVASVNNHFAFSVFNKEYKISKEDQFYENGEEICYYLKEEDVYTIGMVGIIKHKNNQIYISRLWLRSEESLKKERNVIEGIKSNTKDCALHLKSIKRLFQALHS